MTLRIRPGAIRGAALALTGGAVLGWTLFLLWGWIKDDAYISFRYARHLAAGMGLVFNAGERVEGYTNFLWVALMAGAHTAGLDIVLTSKILGPFFAFLSLALLVWIELGLSESGPRPLIGFPSLFLGASTTLAVWSSSGLETSVFMAFSLLGWFLLLDETRLGRPVATRLGSALALVAAALLRPEGHLIAGLAFLMVVMRLVRRTWKPKDALLWCAVILAILVPYHAWRIAYFGDPLPNTFYVKAGGGVTALFAGLKYVWSFLGFNLNGPILVLASIGLWNRAMRPEWRISAGLMVASFLLYLVYVGTDEMPHYRLFLPALPFLYLLAARGLETLADWTGLGRRRWMAIALAAVLGCIVVAVNAAATWELRGMGRSMEASKTSHAALGNYVSRHSRSGEIMVFQDMGLTPWLAPRMRFIDPIGLVDRTVAHAMREHRYHPFLRSDIKRTRDGRARYEALASAMRDYMLGRNPAWVGFVAYVPDRDQKGVRQALRKFPKDVSPLKYYIAHSDHFTFELFSDQRFQKAYRFVKVWPRSSRYYLILYERKDHRRPDRKRARHT